MLQRYRFASVKFYVDCQFNKLGSDEARIVMPVFRRGSEHFDAAREAYRARNDGVDWISVFRRDRAVIDRRWLVFLPEQYMPLGNTSPDLHQVAEALVFRCKQAMRGCVLTRRPGDDAVLCAKNYDAVLQAHFHKSNDGAVSMPQDKDSIRKQLSRMWTTTQVVAADYVTQFIPDLPPNSETGANERGTTTPTIGTGGRFPPKQLSLGVSGPCPELGVVLLCVFYVHCPSSHSLLQFAFTLGTKSGAEPVTHLNQSRQHCPGWTPKLASKIAPLVNVSLTQVTSKASSCNLCPPGGPKYHKSHLSVPLYPAFAPRLL